MNVQNKKCIRNLSFKQFKVAKTRNMIAVLAIALTTLLFTSLFTIAMSISDGFQQSNFRMAGGFSHGNFKYVTEDQINELKEDSLIKEYGLRNFVGMPTKEPFNKSHVEISYSDVKEAHWMYCDPIQGRLPQEGTNEAATDTRVLELLGVIPELGTNFTVTFEVDGVETTQTFTLCGWWEYDEAIVANHVIIPLSRADAIFKETGLIPGQAKDRISGTWSMDVMFKNSLHIQSDIGKVLENHGYQNQNRSYGDNYISTGVNWGYTGTQIAENFDPATVLGVTAVLALIIFTGYLIIYNVFQISVTNDIRFYGLLKTIGTTPRQLRRIIRQQALILSGAGIPLGLLGGWFVGGALTPVIIARLNGVVSVVSVNPLIFIISALFALVTVLLSSHRPGKLAGKVSPVEAVRYTQVENISWKKKKSSGKVSLLSMARANLSRSRGKTAITVISLSLAVVLLNLTVTFTNGFDMDKYLQNNVVSDFILGHADYFQTGGGFFSSDLEVLENTIDTIEKQKGITEEGRIYGKTFAAQEFVTEDWYRKNHGKWNDEQNLNIMVEWAEKSETGLIADRIQLYGMEDFPLSKLGILEGDITPLSDPSQNAIAAIVSVDDYGNARMDSNWAKLGDTVNVRYVEEYEYLYADTMEIIPQEDLDDVIKGNDNRAYVERAKTYRDKEYTVCAIVSIPHPISYRYYGADEFILGADQFIQDSQSQSVMTYIFNTTSETNLAMEDYLTDYTENINSQYDYESKATYVAEFESFRSMFQLLGGALSFIVGLVGVLNFFNAILTGIIARKREFAVLQSIGMTGKQLKTMLVYEGLFYALGAGLLSLILSIAFGPLAGNVLGSMFWFFSYSFTVKPILLLLPLFALLGTLVPLAVYRSVAKATIVERLRETE